jgi:uncharacterized protein
LENMKALKLLCVSLMLVSLPLAALAAEAAAVRQIEWKHLLPDLPSIKSPRTQLNQDQRFDIELLLWSRALTEEEKRLEDNKPGMAKAAAAELDFARSGLNVEKFLAQYREWRTVIDQRNKIVNADLDGTAVRIAGYLLPLEFAEAGVTDFLLLPYVGACIHVPPPPPNQIVFVRLAEKFRVADLFTPVWVSGNLKTKASSKALTLIDGTADITVGYQIDGGRAKIYRE